MKLLQIISETQSTLVYHSSGSIWPLHSLIFKHQIKGVVGGSLPYLSVATDLDSAINDWSFGPYLLEIKTTIQPDQIIGTEYKMKPDSNWRPTRWAINFGYDLDRPELYWFNLMDLRHFDHHQYDQKILRSCAHSAQTRGSARLGECWIRDFMDGTWPEFEQLLEQLRTQNPKAGSYMSRYRQLPKHLRRHNWIHDYRADLYGHAVPQWSPLRPYDDRKPHWAENTP